MLVRSINLKDFQAHKDTQINLSPTITTIVGDSDVGKSAVLRGLRWALLNDFAGDDFVREGAKMATVSVTLREKGKDIQVIRTRGGSQNTYELEGEEFKAFGQGVPQPIANLVRLNEINFQNQHDAPFWFSLGGMEVSRELNSIVDLSIIDSTLSNISRMVSRAKERRDLAEEQYEATCAKLKTTKQQQERIAAFKALRTLRDKLRSITKNKTELSSVVSALENNQAKTLLAQWEELRKVLALALVVRTYQKSAVLLRNAIAEAESLQSELKAPPPFKELQLAHTTWLSQKKEAAALRELIGKVESAAFEAARNKTALSTAQDNFKDETLGQECPTCGQSLCEHA